MEGNSFLNHPFGEGCCEDEVKILQDCYQKFYFEETPFNNESLKYDCYLIVGRRGSGKTSLIQHFNFQTELKNSRCIDIDEPDVYGEVLEGIAELSVMSENIAMSRIVKFWEYIFWGLIFSELQEFDPLIKKACLVTEANGVHIFKSILKNLIEWLLPIDSKNIWADLEGYLTSEIVEVAKTKSLEITRNNPIIISMDTLERYSVKDDRQMMALAALIQCSSNFNVEFSSKGIHIKTFIPAEIYPYLVECGVSNTLKYVRNPVHMHWRPKDLIRLISWRFYSYLKCKNQVRVEPDVSINWADYHDVLENIWTPYFGVTVSNGVGLPEKTFPYVLRHTQMRPRQVVVLCNAIAKKAKDRGVFPYFYMDGNLIVEAVKEEVVIMASEVINAYANIYPKVSNVLNALIGVPNVFKGNYLDKIAKTTASEWEPGEYSPARFKQILAELGIVGVIRNWSRDANVIEADFEYALKDRLIITSEDWCVLHPMFFEKFRAKMVEKVIIYPFPKHPDFKDVFDKEDGF